MRISTSTLYDASVGTMQQQSAALLKVQQQISAGRKILTPADDPVGATRVLELSQYQSVNQQYGVNNGSASDSLSLGEATLGNISALLQDVRDVANNAGNGVMNAGDRSSLASALRGKYQDLFGMANSTDGSGQYLFSGYQGGVRPFSESAPGLISYNGDQGQRLIQISASRQIAVSDAGVDVFQRISNGNGTFAATAGAANTGQGVIDPGTMLDAAAWTAVTNKDLSIKFAGTATLTAAAANTGGASGTAGILDQAQWSAGSKSYSLNFTSATNYDIIDSTTGNTVVAGAAYTTGASINFKGMRVVISDGAGAATPLAGDSFALSAASPAGLTYDIVDNISGNSLLTGAAAASPPYARTFSSGASINLKTQGGEPAFNYGVATVISGTPGAGDSFTLKASQHQDIFKTIEDLAALLQSSATGAALTNGLASAQSSIDNALENVITLRASAGARLKELDTVKGQGEDRALLYDQTMSRLQDLDYAKAASELTQQQVNLEAAQKSFAKVAGLSLFNYL